MHVSHSTNFSVPVTSSAQRQLQPVLECRDQSQHSNQANCDTEDEVNSISYFDIFGNKVDYKILCHFHLTFNHHSRIH